MAQPYLDRLTATFRAANPPEPRGVIVECKHFFSGAALYVDGLIFATLTPAGFAIKLPEQPAPISSRPAGAGGSGTSHEGRSRKTTSCCLAHSPPIASRCARCFARLSRMSHGKMTGWERRDGPPTERRARRRRTIEPWPGTTHVIDNVAACVWPHRTGAVRGGCDVAPARTDEAGASPAPAGAPTDRRSFHRAWPPFRPSPDRGRRSTYAPQRRHSQHESAAHRPPQQMARWRTRFGHSPQFNRS